MNEYPAKFCQIKCRQHTSNYYNNASVYHQNKSSNVAIQQIKDRQYIQALDGYVGEILLVGINYARDNKDKPHSCVIERVEKF